MLFVGLIAARFCIFTYLHSEAFRTLISRETSKPLKARGEWSALQFTGSTVYSEGFKARGTGGAFFSELNAEQVRANLDLGKVWQKTWSVQEVSVARLRLVLGGERTEAPAGASHPATGSKHKNFFLPDKAELRHAMVQEAAIAWEGGDLTKTALELVPDGEAWNIKFTGGTVTQGTYPPLELTSAQLRYQAPTLFVTAAELTGADETGRAFVSGEVEPDDHVDLQAKFSAFPVAPLLSGDWRARLSGTLQGEVKIAGPLPASELPLEGSLELKGGELVALPVLDQIATFTKTAQFRRLVITQGTAKFTRNAGRLDVRELRLESQGLLRVEGGCSVINGQIDGLFQVGVVPSSLTWLPGSQERVFTVSRDGYLWTTLRLTGPVGSPREDLSARLIAAAGAVLIDHAGQTLQQGVDAASGLLNSLLGK